MGEINLQDIRARLDEVDRGMIALLEERMDLCRQVAEYKSGTGKPVYDGERERQKLDAVKKLAHGEFNRLAAGDLMKQLMTISRRYQYQILAGRGEGPDMGFRRVSSIPKEHVKVVYQGVQGAYSHAAAVRYFGEKADAFHVATWGDAMRAVEQKEADYAVLPIENSSAGSVQDNYDLLIKHSNYIVGEVFLPVDHALLGLPDSDISQITTVFSHPQALMQCSDYLNSHRQWKQISVENTAVAAKKVLAEGEPSQAAVASREAGRLYGLKVLMPSINHNKDNTTRFIVLSREAVYCENAGKVSLCFELLHKSGTLYDMLGNFIYNNVNMVMIESRPIPGKNWEYRFFVDIEGNLGMESIKNALRGVEAEASYMRILGSY